MDLNAILKKTKTKSEKITSTRKPPCIALDERPYSHENTGKPIPVAPASNETVTDDSTTEIQNIPSAKQSIDSIMDIPSLATEETNQSQYRDKLETNPHNNKRQIDDKLKTKQFIIAETRDTYGDKYKDKVETTLPHHFDSILYNEGIIDPVKNPHSFACIVGLQRKIILFLYEDCKQNRSKATRPLSIEHIITACSSTISSVKKSLQRLEKKGIVKRAAFKLGRGGWTQYTLSDGIYSEILQAENYRLNNPLWSDEKDKLETQLETELETSASSSSSSNIYITTTTALPDDWKKIDLVPLKNINFGIIELKNIYRKCKTLSAESIQESINHFAFGLVNNPDRYKSMKAPAAILVNQLSQGLTWREEAYISAEEKIKHEKEMKMNQFFEKQFKEPKFNEWYGQLSEIDKENIVPNGLKSSASYVISKSVIQKEHAKMYFDREIWPNILKDLKEVF